MGIMEIPNTNVRRKIMLVCVAGILVETGFETVDKEVLETLTEILQSLLVEIGLSSRNYCELSGRSEPVIGDIILGLSNMGVSFQCIEQYAKRKYRTVLPALQQTQNHKQYNMLHAGIKQPLPNHVPSYFPLFPDPHAYIRTPTHKQPVTEYEAIREKAATQKRDIERALTKFLAKTSETHNLFDTEDNNMFPLIVCKPIFPAYLTALLPQDQIFDPEDLEYEAQVEQSTEQQPQRKRIKTERKQSESATQSDGNEDEVNEEVEEEEEEDSPKTVEEMITNNSDIDNPYLAATKMPNKANGD